MKNKNSIGTAQLDSNKNQYQETITILERSIRIIILFTYSGSYFIILYFFMMEIEIHNT